MGQASGGVGLASTVLYIGRRSFKSLGNPHLGLGSEAVLSWHGKGDAPCTQYGRLGADIVQMGLNMVHLDLKRRGSNM